MKLLNPSDDLLDSVFAKEIAGWKTRYDPGHDLGTGEGSRPHTYWIAPDGREWGTYPRFTTSADAVLPWLNKLKFWTCQYSEGQVTISDDNMDCNSENMATADTFPKACVLALLRAHGVEVEFSK